MYLAPDFTIDMANDRVIISEENGFQAFEVLQTVMGGTLHKFGQTIEEVVGDDCISFFEEVINISRSRGKSLYIYADNKALPRLQAMWFKIILANLDVDTCYKIYNANVQKYNLFYKSTVYSSSGSKYITQLIDPELIRLELEAVAKLHVDRDARHTFCNKYKDVLGIEYLLANYAYNGMLKDELKTSLGRIVKKHFDSILLECKLLFLSHYTNTSFAERIQLQNKYSFDNLTDLSTDTSKVAEFFLSKRLYKTVEVTKHSANSNFIFENMTDDDLQTLSLFADALGSYYSFTNSTADYNDGVSAIFREGYKWQFLDCIRKEFTDELLDRMIDIEADIGYANGIFYNVLLETVNGFTVQHILQLYKNKDKDKLKHFVVFE